MFTGLIEHVGRVVRLESERLAVHLGPTAQGVRIGDSIAVNGACLTLVSLAGAEGVFDLSAETRRVTALNRLRPGDTVNLERALCVGDRLGGHFVLGHVDAVGTVRALRREAAQWTLQISAPPEILAQMIPKGSIAVDGISLTLASLSPEQFSVAVIPHTFENTILRHRAAGDAVNLELDMIGKYVARLLGRDAPAASDLSEQFLAEHGFQ